MKLLKKISIIVLFILAIFAGMEKIRQIDCSSNEAISCNSVIAHLDHADEVASVIPDLFSFNSNEILREKILKSEFFFLQNNCTRIWQPPKLS